MRLCRSDLLSEVSAVRSSWYLLCAGVERSSWQGRCNGDRPLWRHTRRATPACGRLGNASQIPLCQSCTDGRLEWCALRHSPVETSLPTTNKANTHLNCILQARVFKGCLFVSVIILACSTPPLKPIWLRWLARRVWGFSDVSRAKRSQQNTGTSWSAVMLWWSSTALASIRNFSASRRPYSSSSPWTHAHTNCASPLGSHRLLLPATE